MLYSGDSVCVGEGDYFDTVLVFVNYVLGDIKIFVWWWYVFVGVRNLENCMIMKYTYKEL